MAHKEKGETEAEEAKSHSKSFLKGAAEKAGHKGKHRFGKHAHAKGGKMHEKGGKY